MESRYHIIIKRTSDRLKAEGHIVHEYQVYDVIQSICKYIKTIIQDDGFNGFFINGFGKFYVRSKRIPVLLKCKERRLQKLMDANVSDDLKITTNE